MHEKKWLFFAAAFGGTAIIFGAFGAHLLKNYIAPELLDTYKTGTSYHMFQVCGFLALAVMPTGTSKLKIQIAGTCFTLGTILFSGSLYLLSLLSLKWIGAITPIGGTLLIIGWASTALAAIDSKP